MCITRVKWNASINNFKNVDLPLLQGIRSNIFPFAPTITIVINCRWNTTVDKPINERDHNHCQQLITKSHGRSWLDSNIQKQKESNAYLCVKEKVTVYVMCQHSENSYFWRVIDDKYQAPGWVAYCLIYSTAYNLIMYPIKLLSWVCVERPRSFIVLAAITQ